MSLVADQECPGTSPSVGSHHEGDRTLLLSHPKNNLVGLIVDLIKDVAHDSYFLVFLMTAKYIFASALLAKAAYDHAEIDIGHNSGHLQASSIFSVSSSISQGFNE